MDQIAEPHKSDQEQKPRPVRDGDEAGQLDYYYDDSTNYEIYHDDSDEPVEDDRGRQAPVVPTCRKAS